VPVGRALLGWLEGDDLERRLGLVDGRPGPAGATTSASPGATR
jgi:hypothetical protein